MAIICFLLSIYFWVILGRVLLSWFQFDPEGPVATFHGLLHLLTDPLMRPLRRVLPPVRLGSAALDLSPLVLLFGLQIVQRALCG